MMKKAISILFVCMLMTVGMILPVSGTFFNQEASQTTVHLKDRVRENTYAGDMNYFDMSEIVELGQAAWGVTTADFNNDGHMDFAVASATSPFSHSTISIFYNDGTAGFTKQDVFTFTEYIDSLSSGDYNNDGAIDLLFGYSESIDGYAVNGSVNILFNDGNNNFGDVILIIKQGSGRREPFGRINPKICSGDYDLDGDIDFLLGDNSGKIELFYNDGSGKFTSAGIIHDWGRLSWGITSADFDGDGDVDFLVSTEGNRMPYSSYIYLKLNRKMPNDLTPVFNKGRGELIAYTNVLGGSLAPLDYDNDGDMDFIVGEGQSLYLYIYDHGVYFPCYIESLPDYEDLTMGAIASADFNNDGYVDFIAGGTQGTVHLFINKNNQPFGAIIKKPQEKHINIFDRAIPFPILKRTVAFGKITIEAEPFGNVTKVDFWVNGALKYSDTESPFAWVWDTSALGEDTVQIIAWDGSGNSYRDIMIVWRFQH